MTKRIGFLALITVFCSFAASGQIVRLEVGMGPAFLRSPNIYTSPVAHFGFGFGPTVLAYRGEVKFPISLQKLVIVGGFSYLPFAGTGNPAWVESANYVGGVPSRIDYSSGLSVVSVGTEWYLVKGVLDPYLGLRLQILHLRAIEQRRQYPGFTETRTDDGWTRFGLGVVGGVEVPVNELLSLDLKGHYNFDWVFAGRNGNPGLDEYGLTVGFLLTLL